MLVLSRQRNEKVIISCPSGERIEVCITDIRGEKVRLGFTAPAAYIVHREEVQRAIAREKAAEGVGGQVAAGNGKVLGLQSGALEKQ